MNFKMALALLMASLSWSQTFASDLIYTGQAPKQLVAQKNSATSLSEKGKDKGRYEIGYILDQERGVRTVGEAIELKTRGLSYVENISDFEYLTSCPFASPSDSYKIAVGDFIARYVADYVRYAGDITSLNILEARVPHVGQAMAVKSAGLRARLQIQDYLRLIRPAVYNPSDAYRTAISTFTAQNVRRAIDYNSPIYLIIEVEKHTLIVSEAMAVKNAGLIVVRTQRDLFELAAFSVPNPSDAYRQAVNEFIGINVNRYPR